ncbi:hypothetical protein AMK32_35495 [Streptomyces sp. CB01883]|nr:hypothetical protein AMK32_35495 [Streptomyces sp. CB01883]
MTNARRKAGFSCTVSTRALIIRAPVFASFAQVGTSPQRSGRSFREAAAGPSPGGMRSRTAETSSVGATFQFGASASVAGHSSA